MSVSLLPNTYLQRPAFVPGKPIAAHQPDQTGEASFWGSPRTWLLLGPLLFFCLNGTSPFENTPIELRMAATSSSADSSLTQFFIGAICLLCCALMYRYSASILAVCIEVKVMLALPLLAILSGLWSQAPMHSVVHGISLLVLTLFAVYLAVTLTDSQQMELLIALGFGAISLSIGLAIVLPQYGIDLMGHHDNAWKGVFSSKNGCGQTALFLLMPVAFCTARSFSQRVFLSVYSVFAFLLIGMSQAKTAWGLTFVFCTFVLCQRALGRFRAKDASVILVAALPFALLVLFVAYRYSEAILYAVGKDPTLSQRTEIWSAIMTSIAKQPFLGYGYIAFWNGMHGESFNIFMAVHWLQGQAQNGFLDLWLQLGIVGLALFLIGLGQSFKNMRSCIRLGLGKQGMWYFAVIVFSVLYNLDESYLAAPRDLCWLLYVLACVGLHRLASRGNALNTALVS